MNLYFKLFDDLIRLLGDAQSSENASEYREMHSGPKTEAAY